MSEAFINFIQAIICNMFIILEKLLKSVWRFLYWSVLCHIEPSLPSFVVSLVNQFPIFFGFLRRPKGFYSSVNDWKNSNSIKFKDTHIEEIYPTHSKSITLKFQKIENDPALYHSAEAYYAPALVAKIAGAFIYSDRGVVLSPDKNLLGDLSVEFELVSNRLDIKHHSIFQVLNLPKPVFLKGSVVLLASQAGDYNYFHWMFDVLPKIHLLHKSSISMDNIDVFVCNKLAHPYHEETLSILNIPRRKILEISANTYLQTDQLICTSPPSIQSEYGRPPLDEWLYTFLRSTFLQQNTYNRSLPDRIFVNRRDSTKRALINESEVEDFLTEYGFESVSLSNLSVRSQAHLFHNANVIISPHGAGLTNLIFCKPSTKVIEIFLPPENNGNWGGTGDFYNLSNQLKLNYFYLLSDEECTSFAETIDERRMKIDTSRLKEILYVAGINKQHYDRSN